MNITLSKSKYLLGLQCPKLLWYHYNAKEEIPPTDEAQQAVFDQGHEVGNWAKKLYPEGVEVEWDKGLKHTIDRTKELISERKTIFEASFSFKNAYSRADILVPVGKTEWDVIEVKSASEVKDVNIEDVAFQQYCMEGNGLKIRRCHVMFVNNEYVKNGPIDPKQLLTMEDVSEAVGLKLPFVQENIDKMLVIISGQKPAIRIGTQCSDPYPCSLKKICWKGISDGHVTQLYRSNGFAFMDKGYEKITEIPDKLLNDKQKIQRETIITGRPHIEKTRVAEWIKNLEYPLYMLDFETINPAIPLFDGTRPFQHVPFQFSLHIIQTAGSESQHIEFLSEELTDPRPALLKALKAIGPKGTILAYNMAFEKGIIRNLAVSYPRDAKFLEALDGRIVDLIVPFRNFWYYHPKQNGSCSIKYVLPALCGNGYGDMSIQNGSQAMSEYSKMLAGHYDSTRMAQIRKALLTYCKKDTEAMIELYNVIRQ